MNKLSDLFQRSDWKTEKHVPVIECPDSVKSGELFDINISVGKEVAHPNTTEHHIRWIQVFFHAKDEKFSYQIANLQFTAHGEAVEGPNKGPVYTHHGAAVKAKVSKPGTIYALSFCNIHGMWENSKEISVK
jgi:superoxide reductase